jgi:hypothetical protein
LRTRVFEVDAVSASTSSTGAAVIPCVKAKSAAEMTVVTVVKCMAYILARMNAGNDCRVAATRELTSRLLHSSYKNYI